MKKLSSQKGFAAVESLLIVIIIAALIGVGAYVWHAQKQTSDTLDSASKIAQSSPQTSKKNKEIQNITFSKSPASLQTAVLSHINSQMPGCASKNNQLLDESGQPDDSTIKLASNAAEVPACQVAQLYALANGKWVFVEQTQAGFECTLLKKYEVPANLIKTDVPATCFDTNNNEVPYKG